MNLDPEDLIPKLPKPKDLQPFPSVQSIVSTCNKNLSTTFSIGCKILLFFCRTDSYTVIFYVSDLQRTH